LRCSEIFPEAWPITSCRSVVNSPARLLHFSARAASSGDQANSRRNSLEVDLSYASFTFVSDTDLLPYFSRISWSFGRLIPTGVIGPESPDSTTTSIALAVMPRTPCLRYLGSQGMRSSNHCASAASRRMPAVFS
jgi:hypothetical protein